MLGESKLMPPVSGRFCINYHSDESVFVNDACVFFPLEVSLTRCVTFELLCGSDFISSSFQMQADGKPDPSYRMKKNPQGQYIPLSQSEGQHGLVSAYRIRQTEYQAKNATENLPNAYRLV